jgi:hypothetical protein
VIVLIPTKMLRNQLELPQLLLKVLQDVFDCKCLGSGIISVNYAFRQQSNNLRHGV